MIQFLQMGGIILWVILGFSVVIVLTICQRALSVHRASLRGRDFLKGIFNNLQRRSVQEAVALCVAAPGPVAEITRVGILERERKTGRTHQAMTEAGIREIARLEKGLPMLLALAQMAPVLGLLGTVVGMWDMLIALHAQAPLLQSGDLGVGLSRALVTTITGLGIGLIGYFGHAFIVSRVSAVILEMEQAYAEILDFFADLDAAVKENAETEESAKEEQKEKLA